MLDERFRELMRTGLFNLLQIKPTPVGGNLLRLDISGRRSEEQGVRLVGWLRSYAGGDFRSAISRPRSFRLRPAAHDFVGNVAAQLQRRNRLRRSLSFRHAIFNSKTRLSALTFDFDGYSKFEAGRRGSSLSRQFTKQYKAGLIFCARHVEITTNDIRPPELLGPTNYFVSSLGFTQTLDFRDSPFVPTRGFIFDNTFDLATSASRQRYRFRPLDFSRELLSFVCESAADRVDIGTELGDKGNDELVRTERPRVRRAHGDYPFA